MTITLREVKKSVLANGGTYSKFNGYLNGQQAWKVNGVLYTRESLIEAFINNAL